MNRLIATIAWQGVSKIPKRNAHRSLAPFCRRQWGKGLRIGQKRKEKGWRAAFLAQIPWQEWVIDAVGSHGRERMARMERRSRNDSQSLLLSLPFSFFLFQKKWKRSAIEPYKSRSFPRTFPGVFHLPKRRMRKRRREPELSTDGHGCGLHLYIDRPLLRQAIVDERASCTWDEPSSATSSQETFSAAKPASRRNACKREEKIRGSKLDSIGDTPPIGTRFLIL